MHHTPTRVPPSQIKSGRSRPPRGEYSAGSGRHQSLSTMVPVPVSLRPGTPVSSISSISEPSATDLCLRKPRRLAWKLTNSCRFLGVVVVVVAAMGRSDLAGRAPVAFLDVTGGPLEDNSRDATCTPAPKRRSRCGGLRASHDPDPTLRLYRGATPTHPMHGMFSFFPAMPAGGDTGFPRPGVELPAPHFNNRLQRRHKRSCGLSGKTLVRLWESLAEQMHDAGLVLGTRAAPPPRHEA